MAHERQSREEEPKQQIPTWVYLLLFGIGIGILLSVDALLKWLLPAR